MASFGTRRILGVAIFFATFLTCSSVFAQTGGLTGKCTGPGGVPLAGYTLNIERTEIKWTSHVKTNKKGEYTYIGLAPGEYKVTLLKEDKSTWYFISKRVGIGDPTVVDFDMGTLVQEAKKEQESNPEYQKQVAEQKQSASLKAVFDQGRELYNQKKYTEAAATFEKALPLAKDKNVPIVLSQLADAWAKAASVETSPDTRKEDQAKAMDYYQKVLAISPNEAAIHNNLGNLYADMGKPEDAAAEFKKAADLDPTRASSYYYNLGAIMVNKGQMDAAAEALKKATDIDPTNANAWYWYGMALMGKAQVKPDGTMIPAPGTLEAFQTYLKLQPSGPWAAQAQASIDSLQGKEDLEYKKTKKK
ncbi:MAG: tetratricopeptide repeat protein [Terriglobia bacterium]